MAVAQFTAWGFSPGINEAKNHERFVAEIEASCQAAKQLDCKMSKEGWLPVAHWRYAEEYHPRLLLLYQRSRGTTDAE